MPRLEYQLPSIPQGIRGSGSAIKSYAGEHGEVYLGSFDYHWDYHTSRQKIITLYFSEAYGNLQLEGGPDDFRAFGAAEDKDAFMVEAMARGIHHKPEIVRELLIEQFRLGQLQSTRS